MWRRLSILILPCLAACTTPAHQQAEKLTQASLMSAKAAEENGTPGEAVKILERAYERNPTAAMATSLARAKRLSGDAQGAVVLLQDANRKFPRDPALLEELGRSAMAGGYLPEAGQALVEAVALPGASWTAFLVYGTLQVRNNDFGGAEESFNRARQMAPTPRDGYSAEANLALLRAQRGDLQGAIADMEAIAQRPGANPKIQADLALLYAFAGDQSNLRRVASMTAEGTAIERWATQPEKPRKPAARPSAQARPVTPAAAPAPQAAPQ